MADDRQLLVEKTRGHHETDARFGVAGVCCEFIPVKTLMDWDLI